ncbi:MULTISPECIES: hypothetical protein [Streptomyces]|uniref:hypothetical protein n=1 Tax=Streptomyces TaxID=1883 RepID=UPI0011B0DC0D|nr:MULTISPECIES: hypothetical protein [unclassified Streptomyces]
MRRVPAARVVKVPNATDGQPQVRLVDAAGGPVLDQLGREDMVAFMESVHRLRKIKHLDEPLSGAYRAGIISTVAVFFCHAAVAEWDDVPARPLVTHADMPRVVERVPRFIPEDQLGPVMDQVRQLDCPLQRCALLVAR